MAGEEGIGTRALSARVPMSFAAGVALVLAIVVSVQTWRLTRAEHRAGLIALEADTLRAHADSSRALGVMVTALGDSLAVVGRQVVQTRQSADSLDRVLKLTRVIRDSFAIRIRTLEATAASSGPVTETPEGVRSARFVVDSPPYHVTADVTLPKPPAPGTIRLTAAIDSVPLEVRHGCTSANGEGIRSAFVTVVGPSWAPVAIRRVEQDPGLCRSPALEPADSRNWFRRLVDRVGVMAGAGITGGPDLLTGKPAIVVGPSVTAGVKVWP